MLERLLGRATTSPAEVQRMLDGRTATVIDVNSRDSWVRAHVPGARHLDPLAFSASDLPPDPAARLVFYCANPICRKAPRAARRAREMGYTNVTVMAAGLSGWLAEARPTECGD
jgi:rhodanese-related sulfurtransferase